jgi:Xaa-Pro aminopeptidase
MIGSPVDPALNTLGPPVARLSALARRAEVAAVIVRDPATASWLGVDEPDAGEVIVSDGEARPVSLGGASDPEGLERELARMGLREVPRLGLVSTSPPAWPAGRRWVDLTVAIEWARTVKDPDELRRIEDACELVAVGHRALRQLCEPGISEVELWEATRAELDRASPEPVEALVDLMAGKRTELVGQPPGKTRIEAGAPVLFDLSPRRRGYWADSCATIVCGKPPRAIAERHRVVLDALESGLEAARPGVSTGAVDAAARSRLARAGLACPHHIGHGVGTAPQEPPWLSPGSETLLEERMVIALEPGAYSDGFGVRLEHLAVIETDGARPLTRHSLSLTREVH